MLTFHILLLLFFFRLSGVNIGRAVNAVDRLLNHDKKLMLNEESDDDIHELC